MIRSLVALALLSVVAAAVAAPVPKPKGEGTLYVTTFDDKVTAMRPDGSNAEKPFEHACGDWDRSVSPDGKRVLSFITDDRDAKRFLLRVRGQGKQAEPVTLAEFPQTRPAFWSADGKVICGRNPLNDQNGGSRTWAIDVAEKKLTELDIPAEYHLRGVTPSGEGIFLTQEITAPKDRTPATPGETVTSPLDTFKPTVVIPAAEQVEPRVAFPDGKRWVVWRSGPDGGVGVYTAGGKTVFWEQKLRFGQQSRAINQYTFAVSPNGKRVAYVAEVRDAKFDLHHSLWTADPDGTNATKVMDSPRWISRIDWW